MLINPHVLFKSTINMNTSVGTKVFSMITRDAKFYRATNLVQNFIMYKNIHYFTNLSPCLVRTRVPKPKILICRGIRTSRPRSSPFLFLINPILKAAALLTGRTFRKWWKDLPPNRKKYFIEQIKANKKKIAFWLSTSILLSSGYYVTHLEETPLSERKRFMAFTPQQLEKFYGYELESILEKVGPQILPADHPYSKRVQNLVQRILKANHDIKEVRNKTFVVVVVDNPSEDTFVLPTGYIFVFMGMLKLCSNDEQLGNILAHEVAHCVQNHGAENVSFLHILDLISVVIITIIWALFPSDSLSVLTHWLYSKSIKLLLKLPFSRKMEKEADELGLLLAAKACFDVRESSAFWSKMAFFDKTKQGTPGIEFLSTHPNHETRSEYLDSIMDEAIQLRSDCGCPKLSYRDPRKDVEVVSKALEITRRQYYEHNTKPVIELK